MNSYTLNLSTNSSSTTQIKSEVTFDDFTTLSINLSGLIETYIPIYLKIDWGDGLDDVYNNSVYKIYRQDSILNEVMYGKFSSIFNTVYTHSYYPSASARYKLLSAQVYVEYSNGQSSWFVQPIKIVTRDYFESIYDIKLINADILPLSSNDKHYQFSVDSGGFLIEMR
jgi:hypothetical protein